MSNARTRLDKYGRIPKELLRDGEISATAKTCYAVVDEVANYERITIAKLSEWLGASDNTVRRAMHELERSGWMQIIPVRIEGLQRANRYVANDVPFSVAPVEPEWVDPVEA